MLTEALGDDKADIAVGTSWSGGALSMVPVAEECKKILMLEPAIADSLTGANWNRYLFRASCNSSQDALATAAALEDGDSVAFLAPDYVYGKDGVAAFKEAMTATNSKAKVVHEDFIHWRQNDFTAPMQRIFDATKTVSGKKYLVMIWGGAAEPDPQDFGAEAGAFWRRVPVDRRRQPRQHEALERSGCRRPHLLLLVILQMIQGLKDRGDKTILLVEHKMDVIRSLADRIVVLHNGQLVADGPPAEVMAAPVVQDAYLGAKVAVHA